MSNRDSIHGKLAEKRYEGPPEGRCWLVQIIATDHLSPLEYYPVPGALRCAPEPDPREWTAPADSAKAAVFETISIAAAVMGQRTVQIAAEPLLEAWRRVEDAGLFIVLEAEETP